MLRMAWSEKLMTSPLVLNNHSQLETVGGNILYESGLFD